MNVDGNEEQKTKKKINENEEERAHTRIEYKIKRFSGKNRKKIRRRRQREECERSEEIRLCERDTKCQRGK